MGKYNIGKTYNTSSFKGGLTYNYLKAILLIRVNDGFSITEDFRQVLTKLFLREQIQAKYELDLNIQIDNEDYLSVVDIQSLEIENLVSVLDAVNITEPLLNTAFLISVYDNQNLLGDSLMAFSEILLAENISADTENLDIEMLLKITENYQLTELYDVLYNIKTNDKFNIDDKDTQKAVTDFLIGKIDGLDPRFLGIAPFDMYFVKNESTIPIMPTTESTYIDLPSVDGSIVQNTVYKNRFFDLVAVSMQGLQPDELELLKQKIVKILDSTKDETKKLTFADSDTTFNVKYSGQASIQEGASWIRANIPLESRPYAERTFATEIEGNGLIVNDGDTDLGVVVRIKGECTNPNFMIGATEFYWQGTISENQTLFIDNENMTCYLEDAQGNKTNAMTKLLKGHSFVLVPKGNNIDVTAINDETRLKMTTIYSPLILWYGRQ